MPHDEPGAEGLDYDLPARLIDQVIRHQVGVLWRCCDTSDAHGRPIDRRVVRVVHVDVKGQRNCVTALPAECFMWWVSWSRFVLKTDAKRHHFYVPEFDLQEQRRIINDGREPKPVSECGCGG